MVVTVKMIKTIHMCYNDHIINSYQGLIHTLYETE
jgi:hypothetical protein